MRLGKAITTAFVLCFLVPCASGAAEVPLRLRLQQSIVDPILQNIIYFKRMVETQTKGAVSVEVSEEIGSDSGRSVLRMVGGSAFEMGVVSLAEVTKDVPEAGLFTQPFLFNFDSLVHAAARPGSEIRNIIDGEITKSGSRVLWWQPFGSTVIVSKGGSITNPQGLRDHKVGVSDDQAAEFIKLCGGIPKFITPSQQLDGMEAKSVDSILVSVSAILSYEIWKKADTINSIRYAESLFVVLINEKVWLRLSAEQQRIISDAAAASEISIWDRFTESEAGTYELALQKGMRIAPVSSDDTFAWRACSSSILESFLNRTELSGARLFAAYGKLRNDPCCNQFLPSPTGD
jgi:C4-dicarboxylate-binding protein DctP